jgi:superfamily II helicase
VGGEAGFADQVAQGFQGQKIGYTNPRSTSRALARMLLQAAVTAKPTPSW